MHIVHYLEATNHKLRGLVARKPQTQEELLLRSPKVPTARINDRSYILTCLYAVGNFPVQIVLAAPGGSCSETQMRPCYTQVRADLDIHFRSPTLAAWTHAAFAFPCVPLNGKIMTFLRFSSRFWRQSRTNRTNSF